MAIGDESLDPKELADHHSCRHATGNLPATLLEIDVVTQASALVMQKLEDLLER